MLPDRPETAVAPVDQTWAGGGEGSTALLKRPFGVFLGEPGDEVFVFFRFQAAGAVGESCFWVGEAGGLGEQLFLQGGQRSQALYVDPIAGLRTSGQDAGVAAWRVNKDPVDSVECLEGCLSINGKHGLNAGYAETLTVFADKIEAVVIFVTGENGAAVVHQLGDLSGLGAGAGAEVDDDRFGREGHGLNDTHCGAVLDLKESCGKCGCSSDRSRAKQDQDAGGIVAYGFDPVGLKRVSQSVQCGPQSVGAKDYGRATHACATDLTSFLQAER